MKNKIELLAPAGSFDALKAAVQNGADAVYLGLKTGSARMGAENFTLQQLQEAVSYAHIRGVRVYLALNTLIFDSELNSAYKTAKEAAETGVDALILQDLGLAEKISANRNKFPCELHASTQMSIYNKEGLHFLKKLGFSRCITARELSITEISSLCEENIMEIEVFCHGALCMSLSGQCLLSSYIGGRSGNRGTCAQPCRKKYALCQDGCDTSHAYRLSPADFAALPHIKELVSTGVHSLKIEGRLKSPAYVAAVTRSYRQALDSIAASDSYDISENMRNMQLLFGRGDFTSGYLKGKLPFKDITLRSAGRIGIPVGKLKSLPTKLPSPKNLPQNLIRFKFNAILEKNVCINVGDGITIYDLGAEEQKAILGGTVNSVRVNSSDVEIIAVGNYNNSENHSNSGKGPYLLTLTDDSKLREELNTSVNSENKKIPVSMIFTAVPGDLPKLEIKDCDGNYVSVFGEEAVQLAQKVPISHDEIRKQLSKLGDTPFASAEIEIKATSDIFIPVSWLNALRRKCAEQLIKMRVKTPGKSRQQVASQIHTEYLPAANIQGGISLFFYRIKSFLTFEEKNLPEILRPYKSGNRTYYIPINVFYSENQKKKTFQQTIEKITSLKNTEQCKIIAYFPFISLGGALEKTRKNLEYIYENFLGIYIDGFLCQNPGDLTLIEEIMLNRNINSDISPIICCDYSFNVTNKYSVNMLKRIGISRVTLSPEISDDFADKSNWNTVGINTEIIANGRIVLMRSRHCYIDEGECNGKCEKCNRGNYSLKDTFGCEFPVLPQRDDCCSILISPKPVTLTSPQIKKIRSICPDITLRVNID